MAEKSGAKFNIIAILITSILLVAYAFNADSWHYFIRKHILKDENAAQNVQYRGGNAGLIDGTVASDAPLFFYIESSIDDDRYVEIIECIYNDGTIKGLSSSGKLSDENYIDFSDISKSYMLAEKAMQNGSAIKQINYEGLDTLRMAYQSAFDKQTEMRYSTVGLEYSDADEHYQCMCGLRYNDSSITVEVYYNHKNGVSSSLCRLDNGTAEMYNTLRAYWT